MGGRVDVEEPVSWWMIHHGVVGCEEREKEGGREERGEGMERGGTPRGGEASESIFAAVALVMRERGREGERMGRWLRGRVGSTCWLQ